MSVDRSIPKHLHSLDVLRGVAALSVVFWHWQHFFYDGHYLNPHFRSGQQPLYFMFMLLYEYGYLAVDLFFCLSGFVFFWLYTEKISTRQISGKEFFILRFSRLYPLHFVTLLLVTVGQLVYWSIAGTTFVYVKNDLYHFVLHLCFLSNVGLETGLSFNGPVSSVSIEVVLYTIFFVLCRLVRPRALVALAVSLAGFILLRKVNQPVSLGVGAFFLGGCVYYLYRYLLAVRARVALTRAIAIGALLSWDVVILAMFVDLSEVSVLRWYAEFALFPVTILALALAETDRGPLWARFKLLGDISYSTYLLHFPLQLLVAIVAISAWVPRATFLSPVALLAFFAALIGVAVLSHRYFEMPMQRWLRSRALASPARS